MKVSYDKKEDDGGRYLNWYRSNMTNPLQAVLQDMKMIEAELKKHIRSMASMLSNGNVVANFVEKGYSFHYNSVSITGYKYMIVVRNGMNILF